MRRKDMVKLQQIQQLMKGERSQIESLFIDYVSPDLPGNVSAVLSSSPKSSSRSGLTGEIN